MSNVIVLTGRCGRDFEVKYTPAGKAIGGVSIAADDGYGDNKKSFWVNVKLFGERAEKIAQYITKGSQITVSGRFVVEEWTGNDGVKHQQPTIIANEIDLPPKAQQGQPQGQQQQQPQRPQQQRQPQGGYASAGSQPMSNEPPIDWEDNIPF